MRVGSSPELPVYNNLTEADLAAYSMTDWESKSNSNFSTHIN